MLAIHRGLSADPDHIPTSATLFLPPDYITTLFIFLVVWTPFIPFKFYLGHPYFCPVLIFVFCCGGGEGSCVATLKGSPRTNFWPNTRIEAGHWVETMGGGRKTSLTDWDTGVAIEKSAEYIIDGSVLWEKAVCSRNSGCRCED